MDKEIQDIITKVLDGESSKEDKQKLITWLAFDQENRKAFRQTETIWNALEFIASEKDYKKEDAFREFTAMVDLNGQSEQSKQKAVWLKTVDWFIRIAAVVVLIAGLSLPIIRNKGLKKTFSSEVCEVSVPKGSRSMITLPDGTSVWLNAGSKLSYSVDFIKGDRNVFLTGEAFFDVKKSNDRKFIVNTSEIAISVWGTRFNVKAYPEEPTISTTLVEGSISIQNLKGSLFDKETYLTPNQTAIYYRKNIEGTSRDDEKITQIASAGPRAIQVENQINTLLETSWKDEKWIIEGELLGDLAVELERRYDVEMTFNSESIKKYRFTGIFTTETIEQVLEIIRISAPVTYSINQNRIYIDEDLTLRKNYDQYLKQKSN